MTSGSHASAPIGPRSFFEELLDLAGITGQLVGWRANPFMSAYFTTGDWEECWDAKLILSGAELSTQHTIAGVGIYTEPEEEEPPSRYLPIRVFADFTRRKHAVECRKHLEELAAEAKWNDVHYAGYSIRDVGPQHKQLVVNVSAADRTSDFSRFIDAAGTVMSICENHGARVHAP
ncbi:hypothetical protein [Amycolatopsis sp. cmx-4-68]|uniref:hypothetical protein n=1 Tax=Amycolatopsis sp. cmx-4-68 TaxID=2790938 RepID=UPI00397DAAAD